MQNRVPYTLSHILFIIITNKYNKNVRNLLKDSVPKKLFFYLIKISMDTMQMYLGIVCKALRHKHKGQ